MDKKILASAVLLAALVATALAMPSIEREPVRVTNRNSGPRYDIDEVERTKLSQSGSPAGPPKVADNEVEKPASESGPSETSNEKPQSPGQDQEDMAPIGHMTIRRIFLVPMMASPQSSWRQPASQDGSSDEAEQERPQEEQQPSFLNRPFWPFMTPIRAPAAGEQHPRQQPHLFGGDQASRSPFNRAPAAEGGLATSGSERETEQQQPPSQAAARPIFDPIQMMVDMMHQALSGQMMPPSGFHDLTNEASAPRGDNGDKESGKPGAELERPLKPASQNETKEDVVEIDGKKFLRKTIINRHVGENIVFMTKRLIFVPLNETDPTPAPPTETTTTTTTLKPAPATDADASPEMPVRPTAFSDSETTTTTTTTTTEAAPSTSEPQTEAPAATSTSTTEEPSSTAASSSVAASHDEAPAIISDEPTTTTLKTTDASWVDRMSAAIDKAAERIVEGAREQLSSTTTEQPATTVASS